MGCTDTWSEGARRAGRCGDAQVPVLCEVWWRCESMRAIVLASSAIFYVCIARPLGCLSSTHASIPDPRLSPLAHDVPRTRRISVAIFRSRERRVVVAVGMGRPGANGPSELHTLVIRVRGRWLQGLALDACRGQPMGSHWIAPIGPVPVPSKNGEHQADPYIFTSRPPPAWVRRRPSEASAETKEH